jgi:hypothetical protein
MKDSLVGVRMGGERGGGWKLPVPIGEQHEVPLWCHSWFCIVVMLTDVFGKKVSASEV